MLFSCVLKTGPGAKKYKDLEQLSTYGFFFSKYMRGCKFNQTFCKGKICVNLYAFLLASKLIDKYMFRKFNLFSYYEDITQLLNFILGNLISRLFVNPGLTSAPVPAPAPLLRMITTRPGPGLDILKK